MEKIEINWEIMDAILKFGATAVDCADHLGVSHDTIRRAVVSEKGMNFEDYRNLKMSTMRMNLRKKMWLAALGDGTREPNIAMMIWLSKNELGMSDKTQVVTELTSKITRAEIADKKEQLKQFVTILNALGIIDVEVKQDGEAIGRKIQNVTGCVESRSSGHNRLPELEPESS